MLFLPNFVLVRYAVISQNHCSKLKMMYEMRNPAHGTEENL